jgi:hypothetical protein
MISSCLHIIFALAQDDAVTGHTYFTRWTSETLESARSLRYWTLRDPPMPRTHSSQSHRLVDPTRSCAGWRGLACCKSPRRFIRSSCPIWSHPDQPRPGPDPRTEPHPAPSAEQRTVDAAAVHGRPPLAPPSRQTLAYKKLGRPVCPSLSPYRFSSSPIP